MPYRKEAEAAAHQLRIEGNGDKPALLPHECKTLDWWIAKMDFTRFMYQEHADRGYDADKASEASAAYFKSRSRYLQLYGEEFDPFNRPIEIAETCPESVDKRISI